MTFGQIASRIELGPFVTDEQVAIHAATTLYVTGAIEVDELETLIAKALGAIQ